MKPSFRIKNLHLLGLNIILAKPLFLSLKLTILWKLGYIKI